MSIYSDKLTHLQVIINCPYSIAQFCTSKDTLAHISGALSTDDVMSYFLFLIASFSGIHLYRVEYSIVRLWLFMVIL